MAGVGHMGGVSPFGTPTRTQEEQTNTQEEEQAGTENDAQSVGSVGSGHGPTAPLDRASNSAMCQAAMEAAQEQSQETLPAIAKSGSSSEPYT